MQFFYLTLLTANLASDSKANLVSEWGNTSNAFMASEQYWFANDKVSSIAWCFLINESALVKSWSVCFKFSIVLILFFSS